MPVPFIYPPIPTGSDCFRLLRILPSQEDDATISCELFAASINSSAGNYMAGSYTWGLDSTKLSIVLNGTKFHVRKNLFDFLRVLRSEQTSTIIWIDAICIDQSNPLERTQQVGLMADIYDHASAVAIWMGPSSGDLDRSMDMICLLGSDESIHVDPSQGRSVLVADGDELGQVLKVTPFFNLPWWFRIWTVQEYALAKRRIFYCGNRMIEGDVINNYAKNVRFHERQCCSGIMIGYRVGNLKVTMWDSVANLEMLKTYDDGERVPFLQTLGRFEFRAATDPRDKIYGLLGMLESPSQGFLDARYDRTPQEACATLVQAWLLHHSSLDFLEHVGDYPAFSSQSFVPNWTEARMHEHDRWNSDRRYRMAGVYDAAAGRLTDWKMDAQGGATCTGVVIDTITSVTHTEWMNFTELFRSAQDLLGIKGRAHEVYTPTGQSMDDAFALTMTAGLQFENQDPHSKHIMRRDVVDSHLLFGISFIDDGIVAVSVPAGSSEYQASINSVLSFFRSLVYGRRFVVTKKGYFGFAPESSGPGDTVAVLFGSRSPCVLRSQAGGIAGTEGMGGEKPTYQVLGTAYIHGLMHGECFADDASDRFTPTSMHFI
ncbi:hypothetical protein K458DRAFT_393372 [Lentithecium fluviatile CBS 122367]|uniref:Heterokaryon incompatibility domain-containing protein n=1 Tax=Lentithecium fluviatile CBS 122367 TaxID=1168545 RepID=A0A6G1IQ32_9PLEO|nr:hypothetical protein K458DRAFT_393372 [Lentithecium fluviatile CBS 122367]